MNNKYPEYNDENFLYKIYKKREFQINKALEINIKDKKDIKDYRDKNCSSNNTNKSRDHQNIVKHYINPQSPYKGLLLFHGTGSGKTCAAINVAEAFKKQVDKYNTRIFILVSGPIIKQQFKNEIIFKCTNNYLSKEEFNSSISEEKKKLYYNALSHVNKYYTVMSYKSFYKKVLGEKIKINNVYKTNNEGDILRDISINNISNLNNTLLIIDEAHHFTGNNNEYGKALKKIIKNSYNLKILLLSATPMQNLPNQIIDLLNFLRPLDEQIKESDIFKGNNYDMKITESGKSLLGKMSQGYISYYKGNDPLLFAKRKDIGLVPNFLKFTKLIRCFMNNFQLKTYLSLKEVENDTLGRTYQTISNFVFPYIDDNNNVVGVYGESGINKLKLLISNNYKMYKRRIESKFKSKHEFSLKINKNGNISGSMFHLSFLKYFSIKFYTVIKNILKNNDGLQFVYSNFVKSGVHLFENVLLENGFLEYKDNYDMYVFHDDVLSYDFSCTYKNRKKKKDFYPATFLSVTGSDNASLDNLGEEKIKTIISVFNSTLNKNGRFIKVILGSKVMNEGITLQNIKEIHILDTWFTLGLLEQVIGRGIRDCKHYDLMTNDNFFPLVNIFKYVSSLHETNKISKEEEFYYKAEIKFLNIKEVERILIKNAIDCALNYNINKRIISKKCKDLNNISQKKLPLCPQDCEFQSCIYQCNSKKLNEKYYDSRRNLYKVVNINMLDSSTYYKENIESEIIFCIMLIKKLFFRFNYISYQEIKKYILENYPKYKHYFFDEYYILMALDVLTPSTEEDFKYFTNYIFNIYNQKGYLIYKDNYFVYNSLDNKLNLSLYNDSINLSSFVNSYSIKKVKSKKLDFVSNKLYNLNKEEFDYVGILDDTFKLRKKRNQISKYREKGLPTEKGGECITSFKKSELLKIIKLLDIENIDLKNKKLLCYHIEKKLLYLEKYNKDNKIYAIIPINHPIYIYPYNIYSRKKYLEKELKVKIQIIDDKYYELSLKIKNENDKKKIEKFKFYLIDEKKNIWRSNI
jgi:superfamily II DNA or RNA helicase